MNKQKESKTFLGMPMNWEWDNKKVLRTMWNPDDDRLFPPKAFGIGWSISFHSALRKFGIIKAQKDNK